MGSLAVSLGGASVVVASTTTWTGLPGVHKELKRQWDGGVRHAIWDLRMVSTDVVFEHTTPVPISKDHLQSLLVLFLHDFLVSAHLRMVGGHLVFLCLEF